MPYFQPNLVEQVSVWPAPPVDFKVGERITVAIPSTDYINHPDHYKSRTGIECIQIAEHMNFCMGNALKYIWRAGKKGDPRVDLRKAIWYLNREIERLDGEEEEV